MKRLVALIPLVILTTGVSHAALILETSNAPGSPLIMSAGSVSGPMVVNVASDNPPSDIMAAWNILLEIVPNGGTAGTLTFEGPSTGTPAVPANYIFGGNGLGIAVTNSGSSLSANDFFDPSVGVGATVPGSGASLLQMAFRASANASGTFGIYAVEGAANTQWTDAQFTTQFFSNVPGGTTSVKIGEVKIAGAQVVPEPSTLVLSMFGVLGGLGYAWRRRRWCRPLG